MQIKSLRIKSYRSWPIADRASNEAITRMKKLELYQQLKNEGCSTLIALKAISWSKATYYRWLRRFQENSWQGLESKSRCPKHRRTPQWSRKEEQAVLHLRKRFPIWGKRKIWKLLTRDQNLTISESTVGRILTKLILAKKVQPACFYYGNLYSKKRRHFVHHAKRWKYGMKSKQAGQLIQIDHMSVGLPGAFSVKEFKAACPVTGMVFLKAYGRATALNARDFLYYLIASAPFKITSIQVDGGSEFRKEFEQACEDLNIQLFVLPPRKPKWNGCVERANGTSRYEFYPFYQGSLTVSAVNEELVNYQHIYNHYRPHDSLDLKTPMEYYSQIMKVA